MAKRRKEATAEEILNRRRSAPVYNVNTGLGVNSVGKFVWKPGDVLIDPKQISVPSHLGDVVKTVARMPLNNDEDQKKLGEYFTGLIDSGKVKPEEILWLISSDAFQWTNQDTEVVIESLGKEPEVVDFGKKKSK
jgi:hypothetical protein